MTVYHINGYDLEHGGRGKWYATVKKDGKLITDRAPVAWEHDTIDGTTVVWYAGTPSGQRYAQELVASDQPLVVIARGKRGDDGLMTYERIIGLAQVDAKLKPWLRTPATSKRMKEELSCKVDIVNTLAWENPTP
jgi:hypothetical protein